MKILLDTHIFLWALLSPERLNEETVDLLESAETEKYLSAASCWEIAAKHERGDIRLPALPAAFVMSNMAAAGIREMPIAVRDTFLAADLPGHHRDQVDRLLIAQAQSAQMYLVTDDPMFSYYDVKIIYC
jgi:PIN domain nuclease of toxin-antitoxin system